MVGKLYLEGWQKEGGEEEGSFTSHYKLFH